MRRRSGSERPGPGGQRRRSRLARLTLGLALLLGTGAASAETKPVVLRVADHLPANHFLVEPLVKYWMNLVTERSGGAVTFEYYPAEQLGKARDMLTLALTGVTDIAGIVPSYISEKLPLSVVAELPGSFDTACRGTLAYAPLLEDGGALARNEYALLGFRPLFSIVLPPYQVFSRQKLDSV